MSISKNFTMFLKDNGMEFSTFKTNPDQQVRYRLRGLCPSTDTAVMAGFKEKGVEGFQVYQLGRNTMVDRLRTFALLPLWVISTHKSEENINILKNVLEY